MIAAAHPIPLRCSLDSRAERDIYAALRAALAIAIAAFVLLGAAAPHEHAAPLGAHACAACVIAGAEEPYAPSVDVTPRRFFAAEVRETASAAPAVGAPLGAVPGQSPPRDA
jgi:hypothetical protein